MAERMNAKARPQMNRKRKASKTKRQWQTALNSMRHLYRKMKKERDEALKNLRVARERLKNFDTRLWLARAGADGSRDRILELLKDLEK